MIVQSSEDIKNQTLEIRDELLDIEHQQKLRGEGEIGILEVRYKILFLLLFDSCT